ncbi:MAG: carbamoyltransferase [Pseudomonadota bacterium]
MMNILGLSSYYHDSAAALVRDGKVAYAAQEERFTRRKHDPRFPARAAAYCLSSGGLKLTDVDYVVFYDKPLVKFERLLETYLAYAPRGFRSFLVAMPVWLKEKLFLKELLIKEIATLGQCEIDELPPLLFTQHHQSHAASAFYPSPFDEAAVLCMDGVGEWATTSVWHGKGRELNPLWEINFPHSLGLLYSAFTYFTGFKVNSGEYKLMGLAPYGEPQYADLIRKHLIAIKPDGTFRMDMSYFNYANGLTMTNKKFAKLFGGPPRSAESSITQREMDLAASIQVVTEEIVLRLAKTVQKETGAKNLCLAGGVALNCVANGRLVREGPFDEVWVQPAAGDAGGAVGSALAVWFEYLGNGRATNGRDSMAGGYLGPAYQDDDIARRLDAAEANYTRIGDAELMPRLAEILDSGAVVGWFQGPMEFGPRALGGRSIIGDPRNRDMQSVMNLKIKYRESFRPFAPAILAERVSDYFEHSGNSPYMLIVAPLKERHRIAMTKEQESLFGIDKLNVSRSSIPAITHVDYSARLQTVHADTNPRFHALLTAFEERTGCPTLVNTSFNVRGEPIVCTPEDAYRCFMRTEMDYLVVENFLMNKNDQPEAEKDESWRDEFELD